MLFRSVLLLAWGTWHAPTAPAARLLEGLGRVSYAAYLWNYPLALWLRPHDPSGLAALALTLLAALGSWWLVERRARPPALATTTERVPAGDHR